MNIAKFPWPDLSYTVYSLVRINVTLKKLLPYPFVNI